MIKMAIHECMRRRIVGILFARFPCVAMEAAALQYHAP